MPRKEDARLVAELQEANARLNESLKKCRALVADCRARLVSRGSREEETKAMFAWDQKERDRS